LRDEQQSKFKDKFESIADQVAKNKTSIRVLQLLLKDLPRRRKEDDPFYPTYDTYHKIVTTPGTGISAMPGDSLFDNET
jgi:hypothetical protein